MSRSSDVATEQTIARLRAVCGCEAGAITSIATFALTATLLWRDSPGARPLLVVWVAAAIAGLTAGVLVKLLVIAGARIRLKRLLAELGQ